MSESVFLRDMDLQCVDLSRLNLSGANLSDANLRYANLSDVNLRYANLSGANLSDANLSEPLSSMCFGLWRITMFQGRCSIGCQTHSYEKWLEWEPSDVARMEHRAEAYWRQFGPAIKAVIREMQRLESEHKPKSSSVQE